MAGGEYLDKEGLVALRGSHLTWPEDAPHQLARTTSDNGGPSAATARGPVVAATKDVSASTANKESREAVRPIDMQPA
eukprot:CAMPEP_0117580886 /NCGR_PEP_ID=MMETSP0784-20121206/65483_1 /TAXON_ID=39447 /ORGANISM="" /LENGTH=77 /DNA_ID=CAMNT_0005381061 /DNA_START=781 /DNA_END=1012 /DNA_ORIENTATION=-